MGLAGLQNEMGGRWGCGEKTSFSDPIVQIASVTGKTNRRRTKMLIATTCRRRSAGARTPPHSLGVVVVGEGEMVLGLQPAMVGATQPGEWSTFDHLVCS